MGENPTTEENLVREYIFEICNVISAVKNIRAYHKASGNKAREANRLFPFGWDQIEVARC